MNDNGLLIHLVAGARPNFMKIAPLYHALEKELWARPVIVHTGQHYDTNMSDSFFEDLGLPAPHVSLGVGSGTHSEQTAKVMTAYEKVCVEHQPELVVVVGDVNSTMACALVAAKSGIRVAHLEAGLRSFDRRMPEEINRLVTDTLADLLWTPSEDADDNLLREGVAPHKIHRVGNIMIDSLERLRAKMAEQATYCEFGLQPGSYGIVTLHRPSNVDSPSMLERILKMLVEISYSVPLVFPVHPRTLKHLELIGILGPIQGTPNLHLPNPLRYIQFMNLLMNAMFALTDSGGIQEETTYLGIPCLTLRENTERPITITLGTNALTNVSCITHDIDAILRGKWKPGCVPELWDGHTAERIVFSMQRFLEPTGAIS